MGLDVGCFWKYDFEVIGWDGGWYRCVGECGLQGVFGGLCCQCWFVQMSCCEVEIECCVGFSDCVGDCLEDVFCLCFGDGWWFLVFWCDYGGVG